MFISTGAGGAVLPDAGFSHFGQRPFEDGPKREQFVLKMLLNIRRDATISGHVVCITHHIHTSQQKDAVKTEALRFFGFFFSPSRRLSPPLTRTGFVQVNAAQEQRQLLGHDP